MLLNILTIRNGADHISRGKGATVGRVCWASCEWWKEVTMETVKSVH